MRVFSIHFGMFIFLQKYDIIIYNIKVNHTSLQCRWRVKDNMVLVHANNFPWLCRGC